jgi:DNA-binding transcriptional LysR family regulator
MRHFVAVAEELHFGRAALRLHMAQPPLSQSIRRLEDDLGVLLFKRSRLGVEMTEAGHVFLGEARRTLLQAELARKITRRADSGTPEVRISFIDHALRYIVPPLTMKFRQALPNVQIDLLEEISSAQVKSLFAGDRDIAFVLPGTMPVNENFEQFVVQRTRFVAAVPADWPLAKQGSITLLELSKQPFIRPPEKYLHRLPETLAIFQNVGVLPQVVQEVVQQTVALGLVGAGMGCSLVSANAVATPPHNVKFLRISDHPPNRHWELIMLWNPDRVSPSSAVFVQLAKDHVAANPQLIDLSDGPG